MCCCGVTWCAYSALFQLTNERRQSIYLMGAYRRPQQLFEETSSCLSFGITKTNIKQKFITEITNRSAHIVTYGCTNRVRCGSARQTGVVASVLISSCWFSRVLKQTGCHFGAKKPLIKTETELTTTRHLNM